MRKLTTITTQYSKFADNQVLTKGQLNEFLDYFEDQNHLSRISLSGVGIVCGFKVKLDSSSNEISISKGYGVTTDGDLLTLVDPKSVGEDETQENGLQLIKDAFKTYTHYRDFDDSKANYTHFLNTSKNLLEILPEAEIDLSSGLYTSLSDLKNIENKVVLLYLENYPKEGDLCTALDCDNQGIEQVSRLRVLLVSSDNALTIASQDSIITEHNLEDYLDLPEIAVLRDILNAGNTKDYQSLKQKYFNLISNETVANLGKSLDTILNKFNKAPVSGDISSLFQMSRSAIPIDFQYRYDVLKDLVDTYTEIKNLLFHLNMLCCPSIGAFPKHLLLGKLSEGEQQYKSLRHNFYKSPIIGHQDDSLQKVKSLLNRIEYLVSNYLKESKETEIKITPSLAHGVLSNKAIPFYYHVNENLLNHWSFGKYKNFAKTANLSYHIANLSSAKSVQEPLLYNIDRFNFLRIEGVQGKSYGDALDQVIAEKEKYGLSFDVKALSVNATSKNIDINDYECQFEDLSILLKAWRTEQNCVLAEMSQFFSAFSTKEAGSNVVAIDQGYEKYDKVATMDTIETNTISDATRNSEHEKLKESRNRGDAKIADFDSIKRTDSRGFKSREISNLENFNQKNVVEEQLTINDNTVGKFLASAIAKNEGGSANDIMAKFNKDTKGITDSETWKEEAPLAEFIFENIAETLVYSYVLDKRIPTGILEIDDSTLSKYKLTIDELCKRIKGLQAKYQDANIKEGSKQMLGLLINQMSTVCCSGKKLEILLKEIEERKAAILKQIQLSEFVKKHPGLRHQAGVPIGGTFVMAYLAENAANETTYETVRMQLGFVSQPKLNKDGEENGGFIKLSNDRASTGFLFVDQSKKLLDRNKLSVKRSRFTTVNIGKTVEDTVSNLAEFFNYTWRVAGFSQKYKAAAKEKILIIELIDQKIEKNKNYIEFSDLGIFGQSVGYKNRLSKNRKIFFDENEIISDNITDKNVVIADFALPYMCCSDCTPVNFIVPKEPISLSLPKDSICLEVEEVTEPLTFTVSPKDGEVKAVLEEDVNGGVIQNNEGVYQFDANSLDPRLYGAFIKFTVNDQDTDASIIVNKKVMATVDTTITYNKDKTKATVTYTVSPKNEEDILDTTTFSWNFDNGETSTETPDGNNEVVENYELPVNSENTIKPTLSISNGSCTSNVEIDPITFEDSSVELNIKGSPFCIDPNKEETIEIPFELKPDKNELVIDGKFGGIEIKGKTIVIDSAFFTTYNTPIGFAVNGEPLPNSPTVTIINKNDFASFMFEPENPSVKEGRESVEVTFTVTGLTEQQKKDYGFYWIFDDETTSNKNEATHNFDISKQKVGKAVFPVVLKIEGGPCGSIKITKDVTISITKSNDNPKDCLGTVKAAIIKDRKALNADVDLNKDLKDKIIQPTIDEYDEIIKNISEYLNGNKNDKLKDLFSKLIGMTVKALIKNEENSYVKEVLSNYLRAQIRLFYNILHCQSKDAVEKHKDLINLVIKAIGKALENLKKQGIEFDTGKPSEGTLRKFLTDYVNDSNVPDTFKEVTKDIIELILAIKE